MNKRRNLLASLFAGVILTGCASVREVGTVNGVVITDIRQRELIGPCKTTLTWHDPNKPGEIHSLGDAGGPGFIPAIANGALTGTGIAVGGLLVRPSRTTVNASSGSASGGGNVTIPPRQPGPPPHPNVPRQHPNSPGNGGTPGNGGVNNPNN